MERAKGCTLSLRSRALGALNRSPFTKIGSVLTAGRLQILCYHGFSFADEHLFRAKLFMTPARFEQRLHWLKRNNYTVLGLSDAVERLASGRIGTREVAITIDDGFHSVFALASPILESYGFTATIYVASYYVKHPNPIFRLAIQYMAWKSRHDEVDLSGLIPMLCGVIPLHGDQADAPLENFYESVEAQCDEEQRVSVAREFGRRVAVDYGELVESIRMGLMSQQERGGSTPQPAVPEEVGYHIRLKCPAEPQKWPLRPIAGLAGVHLAKIGKGHVQPF